MSVTFTAEQKRLVNTYYPGLGSVPPSVGSGGLLTLIADVVDEAIATGPTAAAAAAQATANAASTKAVLLTREVAAAGAKLDLFEGTDNGVNKVTVQAPAALGANRVITVPDADVTLGDIAANTLKTAMLMREGPTAGGKLTLSEGTDNGVSTVTLQAPAALGGNRTITVPDANVDLADAALGVANAALAQAAADLANARIVNRVDPMGVFGTWGKDVDGAETNGGGLVGATAVLTQVAGGQAKCDNGGVFGNLAAGPLAGYTSNYQLFPDVPVDNDAFYVGQANPFCELAFDIGTAQASTGACIVTEYWNGAAWTTLLNLVDATSAAAADGTRPFEQDGAITFFPPPDWAQTAVDGVTVFWVRFRVATQANMGVALGTMNAKLPEVVTPGDGYIARLTGTIDTLRLNDAAAVLHTTADVKFFLIDYTTGETSGLLTFAQDRRTGYWTGLAMAVAHGDELGVVVVQEDGAAEPANVLLELGYVVT